VFQSVEERYPSVEAPDCVILNVLFALKSPPPCKGAVVEIVVAAFAGVYPNMSPIVFNWYLLLATFQ